MLISTPSIYLVLRKLNATDNPDIESAGTTVQPESSQISNENLNILKKIGKFVVVMKRSIISSYIMIFQIGVLLSMIALLLASTLQPSVPAAVYFIVFLGAATWWACYKELDRYDELIVVLLKIQKRVRSYCKQLQRVPCWIAGTDKICTNFFVLGL